jgi:hypothetical protein
MGAIAFDIYMNELIKGPSYLTLFNYFIFVNIQGANTFFLFQYTLRRTLIDNYI